MRFRFVVFLITLFSFCLELTDPTTAFVRSQVRVSESPAIIKAKPLLVVQDLGTDTTAFKQGLDHRGDRSRFLDAGVSHSADTIAFSIFVTYSLHVGRVRPEVEILNGVRLHSITYPPDYV